MRRNMWVSECCQANNGAQSIDGSLSTQSVQVTPAVAPSPTRRRVRSQKCKRRQNRHHYDHEDVGVIEPQTDHFQHNEQARYPDERSFGVRGVTGTDVDAESFAFPVPLLASESVYPQGAVASYPLHRTLHSAGPNGPLQACNNLPSAGAFVALDPQRLLQQPQTPLQQPQTPLQQPQALSQQPQALLQQPQAPLQQPRTPLQQPLALLQQPQAPLQQPQTPLPQSQAPLPQPQTPLQQPQTPLQQPQTPLQQPQVALQQPRALLQQPQIPLQQSQTALQCLKMDRNCGMITDRTAATDGTNKDSQSTRTTALPTPLTTQRSGTPISLLRTSTSNYMPQPAAAAALLQGGNTNATALDRPLSSHVSATRSPSTARVASTGERITSTAPPASSLSATGVTSTGERMTTTQKVMWGQGRPITANQLTAAHPETQGQTRDAELKNQRSLDPQGTVVAWSQHGANRSAAVSSSLQTVNNFPSALPNSLPSTTRGTLTGERITTTVLPTSSPSTTRATVTDEHMTTTASPTSSPSTTRVTSTGERITITQKVMWEQGRPIAANELTAAHVEIRRQTRDIELRSPRSVKVSQPATAGRSETVKETILHEDIVEETQLVRERIVEVAKPVLREKLVAISTAEETDVVETVVEERLDVISERAEPREVEQIHEVSMQVAKTVVQERVVEVPEVEIERVDVVRKLDVPSFREELLIKECPKPQYVDKLIPEVKNVKVEQPIHRLVPIPLEQRTMVKIILPAVAPVYEKVTIPVYLPRFIEIPIAADTVDVAFEKRCMGVCDSVAQLARAAQLQSVSLCKLEAVGVEAKQWEFQAEATIGDSGLIEGHVDRLTNRWKNASFTLQRSNEDPQYGLEQIVMLKEAASILNSNRSDESTSS